MVGSQNERLYASVDRIKVQLDRGIVTLIEAGNSMIQTCVDAISKNEVVDPTPAEYVLTLGWAPLNAVAWAAGMLRRSHDDGSASDSSVDEVVADRFRRAIRDTNDHHQTAGYVGEQILWYGVDRLPDSVIGEYIERSDALLRSFLADEPPTSVSDDDLPYLDRASTRVRLRRALLRHDDLAEALQVAWGAWRVACEPGELIEVATHAVRRMGQVSGREVLDQLPLEEFVTEALWSPVACMASLSCESGDDERALRFSGAVQDDLVDPGLPDEWPPPRPDDRWGIWDLEFNDVQLFGALSFIDLLCGERERALARAERFGAGRDWNGWLSAGHRVMAGWVAQELSSQSSEQLAILEAIADTRHASLGPLTSRVALAKADLHLRLGDRIEATKAFETAKSANGLTEVRLHFGRFAGYGALLNRVAVSEDELNRFASNLSENIR
jgi:hypothetical protein